MLYIYIYICLLTDIDECKIANICPGVYKQCVNYDGGYSCQCLPGCHVTQLQQCEGMPSLTVS